MSTFSLLPSLPVGPVLKLYFYLQRQQQQVLYFNTDSVCRKVHGFTLNVRGQQQLNYNIVRQNLLDELMDPLDESRNINVVNPNFFTRHSATKQLKVGPRTKRYGWVFDKRVVDPDTFKSYPHGYTSDVFNDMDMENAETLLEL